MVETSKSQFINYKLGLDLDMRLVRRLDLYSCQETRTYHVLDFNKRDFICSFQTLFDQAF